MYRIIWSKTASAQLGKLGRTVAKAISKKLESIRETPFHFVKRLKGTPFHILRVGKYRVIMKIESNTLVIFVIEVGHRKHIYK